MTDNKKSFTGIVCDHIADPNPFEMLLIALIGGPIIGLCAVAKMAFWLLISLWPLFL